MNVCVNDKNIRCEYSKYCSWKNWILSKEDYKHYWEMLVQLNYLNLDFMLFQIKSWFRKWIYDHYIYSFREVLDYKKKIKVIFWDKFYYYISYDKINKFNITVKESKNINFSSLEIYPSCCTNAHLERDKEIGNLSLNKIIYNNSEFFCPLIKYNIFINNEFIINSAFFPYYEPCSLNCSWTISYIHNTLKYLSKETDYKKFFLFLKSPVIFYNNLIFSFNWYYEKGIIHYKGVYIMNVNNISKNVYKENLLIPVINSNYIIIWWLHKRDIWRKILLKYIQ